MKKLIICFLVFLFAMKSVQILSAEEAYEAEMREESEHEYCKISALVHGVNQYTPCRMKFDQIRSAKEAYEADREEHEYPVSLDTTDIKYASYFARIRHQIERVWIYPSDAAKRGISGDLNLTFSISKDGNLLGARLLDRSGYEILDMAALKAVKEAAPFYPFPSTIQREKLTIQANFIYTPNFATIAP